MPHYVVLKNRIRDWDPNNIQNQISSITTYNSHLAGWRNLFHDHAEKSKSIFFMDEIYQTKKQIIIIEDIKRFLNFIKQQ